MAKKTYRVRLTGLTARLDAAIERTHCVFVECLRQMIERYLDMRNGKFGEDCRRLAHIMLKRRNTFAHGVMDGLSRSQWKTKLTDEWVKLAKDVRRSRGPLFEQHECFATVRGVFVHTKPHGKTKPTPGRLAVPAKFWHQVCDSASAYLKSNRELMEQWRSERTEWLRHKQEWENAHPDFMRFWHGLYRQFEQTCEQMRVESQLASEQKVIHKKRESRERGKRIERWHLWYEWVISHPEIIEWRNMANTSDFNKIPPDIQKEMRRKYPRQDKHIPLYLKWLRENNPELRQLDSLRRYYVSQYSRFKRPPTLTLPSPRKHPYWFTLELDVFYKDVDFENGTVRLLLIDKAENGAWFFQWFDARIQCDPRLKPSKRAEVFAKQGRYPPYVHSKVGRQLNKPAETPEDRKAGYAGAKLVLQKKRKELLFTVIEQDCPWRISWRKAKARRCPADNAFSKDGERIPLRVMAVDLGIRHPGGYAIGEGRAENERWEINWLSKGMVRSSHIPNLWEIRQHDRRLRKDRSKRGKPVKGERSFVELQDHRTGMAEDRFKKAANIIVEMARSKGVQIILFEQLERLSPTAFDERWMNRQLRDMNRRRIVEMVSQESREFGIQCEDSISPWLTSHICSRCFKPGWRFSIKKKEPYKEKLSRQSCCEFGYPIWDAGGHLFRCPHCGHKLNADINAAGNVAAKFFGLWPKFARKEWIYTWQEKNQKKIFHAKQTFEEWAQGVKTRKDMGDIPF